MITGLFLLLGFLATQDWDGWMQRHKQAKKK